MQRFKRPPRPPQFDKDAATYKKRVADFVKLLRKSPEAAARAAAKSSKASRSSKASKSSKAAKASKASKKSRARVAKVKIEFEEKFWKKYKQIFAATQFGKCGFCESDVLKTGYGDVEHYRPKGEVWEHDKDPRKVSDTGYWWMAYEWDNYLFACAKCNQTFKGSYFPVAQQPRRLPPSQRMLAVEQPLLLNPYDDSVNPADCLEFSAEHYYPGRVFALGNDPRGQATIRTCCLDRDELNQGRAPYAVHAHDLAKKLSRPAGRGDWKTLRDAYKLGHDAREHCGMTRTFFERVGGVTWRELVADCARVSAARLSAARAQRPGPKRTVAVEETEELFELMGRESYEHAGEVRALYEAAFGETWDDLLGRCAQRAALTLRALPQAPGMEAKADVLRQRLYDLARDNPASAKAVADAFEASTGLKWADLERMIKRTGTR